MFIVFQIYGIELGLFKEFPACYKFLFCKEKKIVNNNNKKIILYSGVSENVLFILNGKKK